MAQSAQTTNFGDLLKDFFGKVPQVGDLVKGTVISIDRGEIRIDIEGIMVGVVRGDELYAESKQFAGIKVGDTVEATVVDGENENGEMELSFRIAGHKMAWDRMQELKKTGVAIMAKVVSANKGGLMLMTEGVSGFLPVSQLNPDHYPRVPGGDKNRILDHLRQFVGQDIKVQVYDVNQDEEKLILSEKSLWENEQKSILDSYKVGDTVEGVVSALTPFGAFMKFGDGLEGLIHISEIVWQRIDHPKDVLTVGDTVKAQIIDLNKSKIYLSLKRLIDDPWKSVKDKYTIGQVVEGVVHKVEPFGLMVKLDNQIHGLAHISDLSDKAPTDIKKFLESFPLGETKKFEIISMDPAEHRLGLKLEGVAGAKRNRKKEDKKEDSKEAETTETAAE
jgi:small subunit ribosomal protein S1